MQSDPANWQEWLSLLRNPIKHQLNLPLTTKQQWLESIAAAIQQKRLHEYGAMVSKQCLMENWVIRNPTCQPPVTPAH